MFIAGTYMLYSPPTATSLQAFSGHGGGTTIMSTAAGIERSSAASKKRSFRVADLLERELVPRKAACVVVSRATASNNETHIVENVVDPKGLSHQHHHRLQSVYQQQQQQQNRVSADASPVPSIVDSRELKFGMDRILSDEVTSRKVTSSPSEPPSPSPSQECPSPACSTPSPWTSCIARCCPLPSCRCNGTQILEPYPLYPYSALSIIGQPLVSYPSSLYTQSLESRHHQLVGHHPSSHSSTGGGGGGGGGKRKRSWSRAVFSNLQRKGLEKRFQIQKYITKPDRRQLAATLGLTDAQVKVWFQNRRMKWRHSKEAREQFRTDKKTDAISPTTATTTAAATTTTTVNEPQHHPQQTQQTQQQGAESKCQSNEESERTKV